uniref:Uncharacterized protein n=1 Tax=viral metagenome TaxID=1070528 RepID=A0A6C0EQJ7_9ZZZZ
MSDPLKEPIFIMHNIFIGCVSYIVAYKLYYFNSLWLYLFGCSKLNFLANISILSPALYWFFYILYKISKFISLILIVVLFWIFSFWMIILIFVPYVVIFPIPIFPFIFILPLKPLMLLLIPPFKTLTDLGTLPLIYRISSRMINGEIFYNFIDYFLFPVGNDISNYLYYNVNQIVREVSGYDISDYYIPEPNENINDEFKNKDDDYMKDLETNDNPDDINKYNEYKNDPVIKEGMKKIEEETNICVNVRQKFKPYNSSYTSDIQIDADNSFSPYNECYINAIKSYLKTSIR